MLDWQVEIEKIYQKHCNKIEKCDSDTVLYHYTSSAGFLGIINSLSLWLSDSDFLNDASESYYFYEIYSKADVHKNSTRKEEIFKFNSSMLSYFHTSLHSDQRVTASRLKETRYILSLSLDKDNLNLWNYYTKNANGIGYCLGLKESTFKYVTRPDEIFLSGKVIYDSDVQKEYLSELINDYWMLYSKLRHTYQRKYLFDKLEENVVIYSVFMKNPIFAHENEYRVAVIRTGPDVGKERLFREMNGAFIPYITQKIDRFDICEVGISPTNRAEFVTRSLEAMLDANAIEAEIYKSNLPLRY